MAQKKVDNSGFQTLKEDVRGKKCRRLYVFYGEETFLLQHYLGQLKKLLLEELTEAFNYHKLNNENFSVRNFSEAVENLPMMAEHSLVHVDDIDLFKLPEADRTAMAELLADLPEYVCVVFTYQTVDWCPDGRMKKLSDVISSHALAVNFAKQERRDLVAWITRHFAAREKKISTELCGYLIDITDGTMTSLAGEIGKICAYSEADTIKRSDIDAVTEPTLDAMVFQMTDYLGQGQYGAALNSLQILFKLQQEPIAILGAIGSHFRKLSAAKILLNDGKGIADLVKLIPRTGDYAARKLMDAARKFPPEFFAFAAELVVETDYKMKTSFDEPTRLLELLILQMSQEAKNGQNP